MFKLNFFFALFLKLFFSSDLPFDFSNDVEPDPIYDFVVGR